MKGVNYALPWRHAKKSRWSQAGQWWSRAADLHELAEVVAEVVVGDALQVVVVRVLLQAAVEERPSQVVDRVLLRLDGLGPRNAPASWDP